MDLISIFSVLPNAASALQAGAYANAHNVFGGLTNGVVHSGSRITPFSLQRGLLDNINFQIGGKHLDLVPDFSSVFPAGKSWTVLDGGTTIGHIGRNGLTGTVESSGLSSKMGTSLGSSLGRAGGI
ncbi:MAG: hypothetical protein ACXWIU_00475 [Limisphaerales bacterium]